MNIPFPDKKEMIVNFIYYILSMGGHGALIAFLKNPGLYKVR